MKEDHFLEDLFEAARNAPSELSFEEVADRFETSVPVWDSYAVLKDWILNHFYLKSFLMVTIVSSIFTAFYLIFTIATPTAEVENSISEYTPIQEVKNEHKQAENKVSFQEVISLQEINLQEQTLEKQVIPLEELKRIPINSIQKERIVLIPKLAIKKESITIEKEVLKIPSTNLDKEINSAKEVEPITPPIPADTIPEQTDKQTNARQSNRRIVSKRKTHSNKNKTKTKHKTTVKSDSGFGFTIDTDETKWQKKTKTFQKEFDLSPNGTTKIINQFGKIHIEPWNQHKAKIEAVVTVSANKDKKIENVLENVSVDFSKAGELVQAETIINNGKKIRWNNRRNWKVSIDYTVFVPSSSTIDIKHLHGTIHIGEFLGKTNLNLNHVDFSADHIGQEASIKMGHGKGVIKNGGNLYIDLLHSEIKAEQLAAVELDLGHSTFEAKKVGDLTGKSHYGKIKIDSLNNYDVQGTGVNVTIQKAKKVMLQHRNATIFIGTATDVTADLEHSKFLSNELENVSLALKFSNFKVQKAKLVKGQSEWGEIDLGSIDRYENNSHHTKVNIDNVQSVKTKGNATQLVIEKVSTSLEVDFEFGECIAKFHNVKPQILLKGKNAAFNLKVPTNAQFQFDMTSNTNNYSFPKDIDLHRQIEQVTYYEAQGFAGDSTVQNLVKVELLWGEFQLKKSAYVSE